MAFGIDWTAVFAAVLAGTPGGGCEPQMLAFTDRAHGEGDVITLRTDGTCVRRIAVGSDAAWSPDGRHIAVIERSSRRRTLPIVDLTGRVVRRVRLPPPVMERPAAYDVAWSPDGRRLAFTRALAFGEEQPSGLFTVPVTGGRPRLLHSGKLARDPETPAWSPDGRHIAFSLGQYTIATIPASGGPVRRLLAPTIARQPSWSPDGTRIAYTNDEAELPRVMVVDVTSGRRRTIAEGGAASWSPGGSRLAITTATGRDAIAIVRPDGSDLRRVPLADACCAKWRPKTRPRATRAAVADPRHTRALDVLRAIAPVARDVIADHWNAATSDREVYLQDRLPQHRFHLVHSRAQMRDSGPVYVHDGASTARTILLGHRVDGGPLATLRVRWRDTRSTRPFRLVRGPLVVVTPDRTVVAYRLNRRFSPGGTPVDVRLDGVSAPDYPQVRGYLGERARCYATEFDIAAAAPGKTVTVDLYILDRPPTRITRHVHVGFDSRRDRPAQAWLGRLGC